MKAVIWTKYGDADDLKLQEIEQPIPEPNEILIKIHFATVTLGDCEFRSLQLPLYFSIPIRLYAGVNKPKRLRVLGQEFAGEVEAVGAEVTRFQPGDRVCGPTGFFMGAYAEYACFSQNQVLGKIPDNVTYEQAAVLGVGGLESYYYLARANIQPGEKVIIVGAGGSIGTFAVQLALQRGAVVTAVDGAPKFPMLRELGASHVIDYKTQDFTRATAKYDVLLDIVGKTPLERGLQTLNSGGRYLIANPSLFDGARGKRAGASRDITVIAGGETTSQIALDALLEMLSEGEINAVVDRRYPLAQIVEAHKYVESGKKQGCVVIAVS